MSAPTFAGMPPLSRDGVELAGEIFCAIAGEQHRFRIGRPREHGVVRRVMRQLLRRAARSRHDVHVEVALAVAGEGNPLAVGRKAGIHVARAVDRDALDVLAVLVGRPDVAKIGERDASRVVVGIADELGLVGCAWRSKRQQHGQRGEARGHDASDASGIQHGLPPGLRRIIRSSSARLQPRVIVAAHCDARLKPRAAGGIRRAIGLFVRYRRPRRLQRFDYVGKHRYFVTCCAAERQKRFTSEERVQCVRTEILRTCTERGFEVLAYVFMPDHLHMLLIGTRTDAAFIPFMTVLRQRTAVAFRRKFGERLWQDGYYEWLLRSQDPSDRAIDYILNNPVRAGLVERPEEYPFAWPPSSGPAARGFSPASVTAVSGP